MFHAVLDISVDYARAGLEKGSAAPKLYTYVLEDSPEMPQNKKLPALIICPGGGYAMTSDREAEPIALRFCTLGFQCFVVRYTVAPMRFPGALMELSQAVATVRAHAEEWHVDENAIFVCGFSAGGHLAASLGVFWNRPFLTEALGFTQQENKPNGVILSYPVITSGEHAHHESIKNLLGERYDKQRELVSLEKQVTEETAPTFLWHTYEDTCVPVENALLFATALREKHIPLEMHIFPYGWHGLSEATPLTGNNDAELARQISIWPDMAAAWMKSLRK